MMEIIRFFFGNFWHFCGLIIVLTLIFNFVLYLIQVNHIIHEEKDEDTETNS